MAELARKRIMRSFRITELSAVDSPAQRHATAVLMKRDKQEQDDMDYQKIIEHPRAFATLADACAHLAELEKVAAERPDLVEKYRDGGIVEPQPVRRVHVTPPEVVRFDDATRQVMARDGVDKLTAMQTVVREQPRLFEEYQAAAATPAG